MATSTTMVIVFVSFMVGRVSEGFVPVTSGSH